MRHFEPYMSVDIETTGLDPRCNILQIGAVFDDGMTEINSLPKFQVNIYYEKFTMSEPYAMSMPSNVSLLRNMKEAIEPTQALEEFVEFINECRRRVNELKKLPEDSVVKLIMAGKNPGSFDAPRLDKFFFDYWPHEMGELEFSDFFDYRYLDVGSLFFSVFGEMKSLSYINQILGREPVDHTALGDAYNIVQAVRDYFYLYQVGIPQSELSSQ